MKYHKNVISLQLTMCSLIHLTFITFFPLSWGNYIIVEPHSQFLSFWEAIARFVGGVAQYCSPAPNNHGLLQLFNFSFAFLWNFYIQIGLLPKKARWECFPRTYWTCKTPAHDLDVTICDESTKPEQASTDNVVEKQVHMETQPTDRQQKVWIILKKQGLNSNDQVGRLGGLCIWLQKKFWITFMFVIFPLYPP